MPRETMAVDPQDNVMVRVGWQRDQDVQLGIEARDGRHLVDMFYGEAPAATRIGEGLHALLRGVVDGTAETPPADFQDSDLEAEYYAGLGRVVLDLVTGSNVGLSSLWTNPLNRYQINHLIRLLRKARDSAYGKDE